MPKSRLEELTKKVSGRTHSQGDFLVVEDPKKVTTWHLPVKESGKPSHRLMGAAKAALTSAGGFRGNKYAGPGKAGAIKKLKALYKSEEMEWNETAEEFEDDFEYELEERCIEPVEQEEGYTDHNNVYRDWGSTSFEQLETSEEADAVADELRALTEQFKMLITNIMNSFTVEDKPTAVRNLTEEFVTRIEETLGEVEDEDNNTNNELVEFSESVTFIELVETDQMPISENGNRSPLELDIEIIQPGWGNKRDKNYYSVDVLRRDAHVFEGVKMYATNHRVQEKSVKTEVSKIKEITGFSDAGAPIARVVVFDPDFAEATRNRAQANELETLECSILAVGRTVKGKVDGQKGNIVEAIVEGRSVDWVTRAGAGGKALRIAESDSNIQEALMLDNNEKPTGEEEAEVEETEVLLTEDGDADDNQETETEEEETEEVEEEVAESDTEPTETILSEAEVDKIVEASKLPTPAKAKLKAGEYKTDVEVREAIADETAYLKEITGSGKPFGQGDSDDAQKSKMTEEEYEEAVDKIFGRAGIQKTEVHK